MISRELAQALKTAGLVREPEAGDWAYNPYGGLCLAHFPSTLDKTFTYAPRLDQLITEIEKRGYTIWLNGPRNDEGADMKWSLSLVGKNRFYAATPEEAAGQALLGILQKEGKVDGE